MRFWKFLAVFSLVIAPSLVQGEVIYLRDGSTIQGKLVRFLNDTLYFKTTFGTEFRVPRAKVLRIEFADARGLPQSTQLPSQTSVDSKSAAAGTVQVHFEKFRVSSRISVHRGKNRERLERANSIEKAFYVGGEKVYSMVDSVTDKVIREGPETILRNDLQPEGFKVAVAPGTYRCRLYIGNASAGDYADRFVGGPLDKKLLADNVTIRAGETTELRIGLKRRMRIGSGQLYVFE